MWGGVESILSSLMFRVMQTAVVPHISTLSTLPAPYPTVHFSQVPVLFREPHILSGYRPLGQPWCSYILSLFQSHNELLNVWTHMLAVPVVLLRFWFFAATGNLIDNASWLPLCLFVLSVLTYLSCSTAAHLLHSHSELSHYSLFFLDYVGVAMYQYGSALAHYYYCAEEEWRQSLVGTVFLPTMALLGWLSCASCCYAKQHYRRPYPISRKLFQVLPNSLAYLLYISPIAHRLVAQPAYDTVLVLHALQVAFFLTSSIFFSFPFPECFFPGKYDIVGHGHQIFHILLAMCTMCQMEAVLQDFLVQRMAMAWFHGWCCLWLAGLSYFVLLLCCLLTAAKMRKCIQRQLECQK